MASIMVLPNEILDLIIKALLDRNNDFNPDATRHLQNMRLACRKLHAVATPILFQNIVLDFKLWENGDRGMRRVIAFATKYPDLAKYVHRLQLQAPPIIPNCNRGTFRLMKHRLHWLKYRMHWTAEKISIIGDAFGLPLQERNSSQMAAVSANSMSGVSTAIYDTIQSLPNLRHVEHAISSQESRVFRNLEFDFFNKTRIRNLRDFLADPSMHLSFGEGLILVLENLNPTITSLKLRSFPVCADCYNGKILPATLQHLDLEIQEPNSSRVPDPSRQTFTDGWRSTLESLKQLRALRLALDTFCERPLHSFYVDDVLINREDSTKNSFFPHLTRLSLTGCSLRMGSLISFATSHSSTLKDLELNRITFDPSYRPGSWSEIGALCKSVLPGLVRLRLARLVIQGPRRWVDPAQIPARWSQGLEDATAYEWEKGVHGPDTESIGSRCPWEPGKLTL